MLPEWFVRPAADTAALARDLIALPREVLLVRAHHRWTGALCLTAVCLPSALSGWRPPTAVLAAAVVLWGLSLVLDLAGMAVHVAWHRGRIWQDITCQVCGDDEDDEDPGDDGPDDPDDPHGLTRADHAWLHAVSAGTRTTI